MSILAFQQPDKVVLLESNKYLGRFEFRPLEPGYGITIGNSIRRVLLSSLEGFAITSLKITGIEHEFSSIEGVVEDVTEIILNLKQIRLIRQIEEEEYEKVTVIIKGQDVFKGGDINKYLSNFQVINTDFEICHLDPKVKLEIELIINKGRGYVPSELNKISDATLGTIAIDSIHTPVKNVKYSVEDFRVEQKTDFEKLLIEILTDGSISPKDALKEAAIILIEHYVLFSDEKIKKETEKQDIIEEFDEKTMQTRKLLKKNINEFKLPPRAANCLKTAEINTLSELVILTISDLMKFRNFGKKSLDDIAKLLDDNNLTLGMNITKYKLDNELER